MSSALGISAVTAVLQSALYSVYTSGTPAWSVTVSAVAPDIVQSILGKGVNAPLQVNLFLHQVTPNAAWRNIGLPSLGADGSTRLKNQPLALDLHYLLTVYASEDYEAEALLGYAVQYIHENPVLTRGDIKSRLVSLNSSTANSNGNSNTNSPSPTLDSTLPSLLSQSGLENQIEMIKITPSVLGREEMAWLWTALKADYRPTFPFQASVVLIQARNPSRAPLPVLTRNVSVQAGLLPMISSIAPPAGQSAACQGDIVTVKGNSLSNAIGIVLSNARLGIQYPPITPTAAGTDAVQFVVPNDPAGLLAGVYLLSVQIQPSGSSSPLSGVISTNSLPLAIAPQIAASPPLPGSVPGAQFTLSLACVPDLSPRQQVSLVLGSTATPLTPPLLAPNELTYSEVTYNFQNVAPGDYLVRLRVDGIDSPVAFLPPPGSPSIRVT